ncbi:MAG: hypothetical protein HY424_02445, partial [Candidatus Levybacteria bacterium]|nr:hypothetical protein [Candidatus Levybacteria bacterium]
MTRVEVIKFLILRSIGNFLVLFAIFGALATFGPAIYYEVNFRLEKLTGVKYKVVEETLGLGNVSKKTTAKTFNFTDVLSNQKERILIPIDTSFGILIPKIGANA